ncbi:MAG: hypothetical protein GXP47_02515 [Acidobacteria bacterium]|nr:hypothetical protein [Acidobacteriota bacterium]
MSATPPVILPTRPPRPREDAGRSRWAGIGCGAVIIVLAALILGSFLFFDRGVQWAVRRAADRIEERMDPAVPAAARELLRERMEQLCARSGEAGAAPRNGAFLQQAGKALEDGRVSTEEVAGLNAFLAGRGKERAPAAGGPAP